MIELFPEYRIAKPFLKWAGGKTQLLTAIESSIDLKILSSNKITYVEPFVGSGAVMFWVLSKFPNIKQVIINDVNKDLINAYKTIKSDSDKLIAELNRLQKRYFDLSNEAERKEFYLIIRESFNSNTHETTLTSAYLIFLNRTCFNGLYRVNSKNKFNVPFGKYANPRICDAENIKAISYSLKNVKILNEDFETTLDYVENQAFFYFDPPYRPLTKTAAFNSYSSDVFDDAQQIRLARFCDRLNSIGHSWLLSNSDPKNIDELDNFFDDLYSKYYIKRVNARRMINSDSSKRGEIKELLISNYPIA